VEILAGRLDSPITPVRRMASCVALVFSKVIDVNNPLFLDDDNCQEEIIDWDFGVTGKRKETARINGHHSVGDCDDTKKPILMVEHNGDRASNESMKTIDVSEDNRGTNASKLRRQRKKTFELKVDVTEKLVRAMPVTNLTCLQLTLSEHLSMFNTVL
jgi:hypothetical protein